MEENNFSNNVIQSSLLPKAEEVAFELLHPNLPKVHLVFNSCVILILVVLNILNYQFNWANPILSYVALGVRVLSHYCCLFIHIMHIDIKDWPLERRT